MSMQPFHTSALFTPGRPPAVITLILIENSRTVSAFWPDLRDHYVRILLGRLEAKHPDVVVGLPFSPPYTRSLKPFTRLPSYCTSFSSQHTTLLLETRPVPPQFGVRRCESLDACLDDVEFNFDVGHNAVSAGDVWNAIEVCFQLRSASRAQWNLTRCLAMRKSDTVLGGYRPVRAQYLDHRSVDFCWSGIELQHIPQG